MRSILTVIAVQVVMLIPADVTSYADDLTREQTTFFESKIRPVLVKECYGCHSNKAGNVRGGLRLDTKELILLGGSSGPAVVPGDAESSLIFSSINHEDFEMPPKRKLPANVIEDFRKWIEMGAPDPRKSNVAAIQSTISPNDIAVARDEFWAYQHPTKQKAPKVSKQDWAKTEIDRFVLARLEAASMKPADDAPAYKVLRRIHFDLVGLPPKPSDVGTFTRQWNQDPDQAISQTVNRLLDSHEFGQRWGRHWLDVARYAESTGREVNMTYPHAWRYRDYVIDSFNADKPFDQFVQEQIAGDLMPTATDQDWAENLVATTFLAMGPKNVNEQNRVQFEADLIDEQIDATTRVFLGMSVACARCHDHKFDAIPQTDYYAMAGIFGNATTYFGNPPSQYGSFRGLQARRQSSLILLPIDDPNPYDKRYTSSELSDLNRQMEEAMAAAAEARRNRNEPGANVKRIRTLNQLSTLSAKLAVVDEQGNPRSYCMGVQEKERPGDARLLVRGEIDQAAQTVPRGFPQVLCSTPATISSSSSGRLELARWIGSDENTLAARVMVNRIWKHLVGQGIVVSTENFGVTGQTPSHPALLDHLAVEFVESGWSVKSIIRKIVSSRFYRMGSDFNQQYHEQDPDNALLWRANPKRLDAEAIRDAMLSISGQIDYDRPRGSEVAKAGYVRVREGFLGDPREAMRTAVEMAGASNREQIRKRLTSRGGPNRGSTFRRPGRPFDREMVADRYRQAINKVQNQLDMEDATYRSVYLPIVRDHVPRSLAVFDFADSNTVSGVRESSNTANQALYMMNNPFVITQSEAFAKRVARHDPKTSERLKYAFLLAYGRQPTKTERQAVASFLKTFTKTASGTQTMATICQSLFASAEFRYID